MSKVFTYQTRLPESRYPALDAYAMLYGQVERKLFAALQSGRGTVNQLKRDFLCRFGITARPRKSAPGAAPGLRPPCLQGQRARR